jgi:cytochrome c oxidase cbb3-type subunit IV
MEMELVRSIVTVAAFVTFLGIWAWAWSARRSARFAEAANLPFDEGELEAGVRHAQPSRTPGTDGDR